jgi:protein-S-isoprenylcysteine O-methyltransferase Ste14
VTSLPKLLLRSTAGLIVVGAMLFVPAGSVRFWQGWVFIALLFPCLIFSTIYLYKTDPQLVERRLQAKEPVKEQKILVRVWKPLFFVAFLIPGFDYRLGWSRKLWGGVPVWLVAASDALVLSGYFFVLWVLMTNSYASRTIRVEQGQTIITKGPYGLVRHPMYLGSMVLWLFMSLALGSYVALPIFALMIPFYVMRLLNEEKVLRQELPGYTEYCAHTRYRLIPSVW